MKIETFGASDIGLVRLNNEDVFAQMLSEQFFILADGMGGHSAGEVAAKETVIELCKFVKENSLQMRSIEEWTKSLKQAIQNANTHVLDLAMQDREKQGMGTTLCLCLVVDSTLIYAHVGDSRIYRVRKNRLTRLTRDHSLREELIASGELDESQAPSFPHKNVITRAIGTQRNVIPDIKTSPIESGDLYLLCSDGLSDSLLDAQIHDVIDASTSLRSATENLILEAKKSGGRDNITVVLFKTLNKD